MPRLFGVLVVFRQPAAADCAHRDVCTGTRPVCDSVWDTQVTTHASGEALAQHHRSEQLPVFKPPAGMPQVVSLYHLFWASRTPPVCDALLQFFLRCLVECMAL